MFSILMVMEMAKKRGYDWKITLRKGIEVFIYGGIGALISWLSGMPKTETVIATVTLLKMLQNYLKHRND